MNLLLVFIVLNSVVVPAASVASCDGTSGAYGGWKLSGEFSKGADGTACVGSCLRWTWSDASDFPFYKESGIAPSTIEDATTSWFDSNNKFWCATVADYQITGTAKKNWGYCNCDTSCDAFSAEDTCNNVNTCVWITDKCYGKPETCKDVNRLATLFDSPSVFEYENDCVSEGCIDLCKEVGDCSVYFDTCYDTVKTCDGVNGLFSGRCGDDDCMDMCDGFEAANCTVISKKCAVEPTTCQEVNTIFSEGCTGSCVDICEGVDSDCLVVGKQCLSEKEIPTTCSGIDDLFENSCKSKSCVSLCEDNDSEECIILGETCLLYPQTCDDVDYAFDSKCTSNACKKLCNQLDTETCSVIAKKCINVESLPQSCSYVDTLFESKCSGQDCKKMCRSVEAETCLTVNDKCVVQPSSCDEVNDLFEDTCKGPCKKMCKETDCDVVAQSCIHIDNLAGNCSEINDLFDGDCSGDACEDLCTEGEDGVACMVLGGQCTTAPQSCDEVLAVFDDDCSSRTCRDACDDLETCKAIGVDCLAEDELPDKCADVDAVFGGTCESKGCIEFCEDLDAEECYLVDEHCSKAPDTCAAVNTMYPDGCFRKACRELCNEIEGEECDVIGEQCILASDVPTNCSAIVAFFGNCTSDDCTEYCKELGCGVYGTTCAALPASCAEVNELFADDCTEKKCKKACREVKDESCTTVGSSCVIESAVPTSCSAISGLFGDDCSSTQCAKLCTASPDGCVVADDVCTSAPSTCSAVHALFSNDCSSNKCDKMCSKLEEEKCLVIEDTCIAKDALPTSCSGVASLFQSGCKSNKCLKMCKGIESCDVVGGVCQKAATTCEEIDSAFEACDKGACKKACKDLEEEECMAVADQCLAVANVTASCSIVNELLAPCNTPLCVKLCKAVGTCSKIGKACVPVPTTCLEISTLFKGDCSKQTCKKACKAVKDEECALAGGDCVTAASLNNIVDCDGVNSIFQESCNTEKCQNLCRGTHHCDVVEDKCTSINCPIFKDKSFKCERVAGCSYTSGNCCDTNHPCMEIETQEECSAQPSCSWYGSFRQGNACSCTNQ